jgi:hypothetical protein
MESPHISLKEYEHHEGENVVCSPSETQSCELSQTRIVHEVENIQQTYHHRLNIPITCTTTKGTKPIITTTPKVETLSTSGRKAPIPPRWDRMHNTLTPRHNMRLRHTTRRAVPVLVCHLPSKPLLPSSPEAKLSLMAIPPTMLTMEADWFYFGCCLWFLLMLVALHTRLLTWFFSQLMCLVWLGGKLVLRCTVWWNWSFHKLPFSLTTALPHLI